MAIGLVLARGGSVSIPKKNIVPVNGRPLIYYILDALCGSGSLTKVYVSTDSDEIADIVERYNSDIVEVFERMPANAQSESSSEDAIIEFLNGANISPEETLVFAQATSPLTKPSDISQALEKLKKSDADSLLTVVRQKRFIWSENGEPMNYSPKTRPRRQDFDGFWVENGAFYISGVSRILETRCRISGKIEYWEMPEETYYELDELHDLEVISKFLPDKKDPVGFPEIRIFISDIDGTLTDGGMYYSAGGEELKKFNTRDGMVFELLKMNGLLTALVTSENSQINSQRAKKLSVDYLIQGKKYQGKLDAINALCKKLDLSLKNVAYIGDDLNCKEALSAVTLSACPCDAIEEIKNIPGIKVMSNAGGYGAVREFGDYIIRALNA
jgi:YrbI family 3-deoxy-D-manno-octulosonate 8-phosphate phosphatase